MAFRRIPSLNWLRVFEAAARLESFARAAELLNMSPAAVSQQVKALEENLGRPLFIREARRVILTDAGHAFLPTVSQSLAAVETSAAALFGTRGIQRINVQVVNVLASNWLPGHLSDFEHAHPGIHVQMTSGNATQDFTNTGADLQIAFGSSTDFPADATRLFGEMIYPVARPEIASQINGLSDFLKFRLIEVASHKSSWFQLLQNRMSGDLREADFRVVDNTVVALGLAATGYGSALARAPATDFMMRAYGLVPCLDGLQTRGLQHYFVFQPTTRPQKPTAVVFRQWLTDISRQAGQ